MIKLVVFDWNGTLIADTKAITDGVNEVLFNFTKKKITIKKYQENYCLPFSNFYVKFGIKMNKLIEGKITKMFHTYYENRACKLRTRSYVREVLDYLNKKSINCVLLSNHTQSGIKKQLKRLNLEHYFFEILAQGCDVNQFKQKPKGERLNQFIKSNKYSKNQVIIIGDTEEESYIAKDLGIKSVLITGGVSTVKRLKKSNPDYLIKNMKEIIKIFENQRLIND